MAGWLISRLASGLGVAAKDAVFPLARKASSEPLHTSLIPAAAHAWRRWSAPENATGLSRAPPSASLSTSAYPASDSGPEDSGRRGSAGEGRAAGGPAAGDAVAATASAAAEAAGGTSSGGEGGGDTQLPSPPLPDPKPELVEKFLSLEMLGGDQRRRVERQGVLRDFQRHPADTGSPPVMVALWTHRVRELVRHFDSNRKQLPAMRQLEMMVNQRRRMLIWLRRSDFDAYSYTIAKLGLRDMYTPTSIADRYREGLRPSDPVADDSVIRWRFNFHTKYRQRKASLWNRLRPKLVAEDPSLTAADATAAADSKQRRQAQRVAAAKQRL